MSKQGVAWLFIYLVFSSHILHAVRRSTGTTAEMLTVRNAMSGAFVKEARNDTSDMMSMEMEQMINMMELEFRQVFYSLEDLHHTALNEFEEARKNGVAFHSEWDAALSPVFDGSLKEVLPSSTLQQSLQAKGIALGVDISNRSYCEPCGKCSLSRSYHKANTYKDYEEKCNAAEGCSWIRNLGVAGVGGAECKAVTRCSPCSSCSVKTPSSASKLSYWEKMCEAEGNKEADKLVGVKKTKMCQWEPGKIDGTCKPVNCADEEKIWIGGVNAFNEAYDEYQKLQERVENKIATKGDKATLTHVSLKMVRQGQMLLAVQQNAQKNKSKFYLDCKVGRDSPHDDKCSEVNIQSVSEKFGYEEQKKKLEAAIKKAADQVKANPANKQNIQDSLKHELILITFEGFPKFPNEKTSTPAGMNVVETVDEAERTESAAFENVTRIGNMLDKGLDKAMGSALVEQAATLSREDNPFAILLVIPYIAAFIILMFGCFLSFLDLLAPILGFVLCTMKAAIVLVFCLLRSLIGNGVNLVGKLSRKVFGVGRGDIYNGSFGQCMGHVQFDQCLSPFTKAFQHSPFDSFDGFFFCTYGIQISSGIVSFFS